jgi:uncharacterized membrane protein
MIASLAMASAGAQTRDNSYRGLWISTPYPSIEVAPGDSPTLDLKVHNAGLPPQRVELTVAEVPKGWKTQLLGGGKPVGAVFVGPDSTADLQMKISPPKQVSESHYRFAVTARGSSGRFRLPLEVTIGKTPPSRLVLKPDLPILPGTPDSTFSYKVNLTNDTGRNALIALHSEAPRGFQISFTQEFGSQKLTSVAVDAGKSKGLKVDVHPPQGTAAGTYTVTVRAAAGEVDASTDLKLQVSGQAKLQLTAPGDRLSGQAYAGKQTPLQLLVHNTGSAPAEDVSFSASQPQGWQIKFDPPRLNALPPGKQVQVKALVTPPSQAIAGDYMLTLRANSDAASESSDFRVTVRTSTIWGIVGVAVIAAAVAVLALAVMRFGRR